MAALMKEPRQQRRALRVRREENCHHCLLRFPAPHPPSALWQQRQPEGQHILCLVGRTQTKTDKTDVPPFNPLVRVQQVLAQQRVLGHQQCPWQQCGQGKVESRAIRSLLRWTLEASFLPEMQGGCARFPCCGYIWAMHAFYKPLKYRLCILTTKNLKLVLLLHVLLCCQWDPTEQGGLTAWASVVKEQNFAQDFQHCDCFIILFLCCWQSCPACWSVAERLLS